MGFEVLPLTHVAFHDAFGAHRHGAHDGNARGREDRHHEAHHHEAHHHDGDDPPDRQGEHGQGSLAHHDLAAPPAQITLPAIPEARVAGPQLRLVVFEDDPSRMRSTLTRARAPPRPSVWS